MWSLISIGNLSLLWIICGVLFTIAFVAYFIEKRWWPFLSVLAVLLSQVLIFQKWEESRWGTLLNLIILLASVPALGKYRFNKKVQKEVRDLLLHLEMPKEKPDISEKWKSLPGIVQKWLEFSGVSPLDEVVSVRLRQQGRLKLKPEGKWWPFKAVQYFDVKNPAFIWITRVEPMPFLYLVGRDLLKNTRGEMLIKLYSVIPVVNEKDNFQVSSAALQRFLAELCWFPQAAIEYYIEWEEVDEVSARATLSSGDIEVSGLLKFSEKGELMSFETKRFYGGKKNAEEYLWRIEMIETRNFSGINVPGRCKVSWELPEGRFTWLKLEVLDLEYNSSDPYP